MKKSKALIGTDFHIRPAQVEASRKLLKIVLKELKERQPEYFINLGDTFHTKNQVYISALELYREFLKEVLDMGIKVIHLVGNHDYANPFYTHHALDPFKGMHKNLNIVDESFVLGDNVFISYRREKETFAEILAKAGKKKRIFAHMDINGMTPGSGWEEINPFFNPEEFEDYEAVFSGHLHLAQEKRLKNGTEIVMVGSGYTTDFGESDQDKRLLWIDLETGKWEGIDTGLTLHKTFRIKAGDPLPEIDKKEVERGVNFRVIFTGTKEEYDLLVVPKNYLAPITPEFTSKAKSRIDLSATETKDDTMKKYIEEDLKRTFGSIEESGLDVDELLKVGKRYLPKG